ncbi:hypothetical protein [Micromonospora aurantiaca (nom. illeg.)]|uniref:hypothetical protein n=1 Tax=Micromonospora aurantiaca (nom. illeg.) TaxID=47850 RepID=UPI0033F15E95
MLNPGTLPVENPSQDDADANMRVFVAEVGERGGQLAGEPARTPSADRDGRYGYQLRGENGEITVLMPGADLARVRDDLTASAPCLYVGANAWWWGDAVGQAARSISPRRPLRNAEEVSAGQP